jgi:hypothetical protein
MLHMLLQYIGVEILLFPLLKGMIEVCYEKLGTKVLSKQLF